jgi:CRP-like cAMP-binding protein
MTSVTSQADQGRSAVRTRKGPRRRPRRAAQLLARAPLFAGLPRSLLDELARQAVEVTLGGGDVLWRAGDPPARVGVVATGRLKLRGTVSGREVILDVVIPGDVVGEVGFSLGEPHASDVVSLRRSRVLLVPAGALRAALDREPRALAAVAFDLAQRVRRLVRLVEDLSAGSVERRLAGALVGLVERAGEPFPGGLLVPLRLRRADLAALAATSPESASRRISAWRRAGIVLPQPAGYLVKDLEALRRIAGGGTEGV